ncbi:MAG: DUF6438 domain-containing protein [Bacteroidota bacterium]
MKNILLFLAATFCFAACCRKVGDAQPTTSQPTKSDTSEPAKADAFQVVGYEKTACFGRCPVYQDKFFSDGKVTWYGRMNVERMGNYEAQVKPEDLRAIREKADEVHFFDFYNEYPTGDRKIADLPSTKIYLRVGDMEKQVTDTHEAPEKLKEFEKYLEDLIGKLEWKLSEKK